MKKNDNITFSKDIFLEQLLQNYQDLEKSIKFGKYKWKDKTVVEYMDYLNETCSKNNLNFYKIIRKIKYEKINSGIKHDRIE